MDYVFTPPEQPSIAIAGSPLRFPVRRIFCVGRNYAAHAREMGGNPEREPPFFFTKPADAIVADGATIAYPPLTADLQHEGELVVAIGRGGRRIAAEEALSHVYGYAAGNDLTRRDLQNAARVIGRPWDWGKAFDDSAPCGAILPAAAAGSLKGAAIEVRVNGEVRQSGSLEDLIWSIPEVIAILSTSIALAAGDLIYTGTPAGVSPLLPGDMCEVDIVGIGSVTTRIGQRLA